MAVAYTCNLDWFTATLTGDPMHFVDWPLSISKAGGSVTLQKADIYNRHYQGGYQVNVKGKPFGKVLVRPREGNALLPQFVQFTADNNRLYEIGFIAQFEMICQVLGWKWRNPTRIDIALDGHDFHKIIEDVLHNKVRQVGHATYGLHFRSQNRLQGYTWGKGDSDKYMRCYDKTEELKVSNKWYIKEFWDRAGLDQEGNVQRLEVVLRNDELKKYDAFNPSDLDNFEHLATLMRSSFQKWFQFVDPSTDCNVSRMKGIEYIDWDSIGGGLLPKASSIPPNEYFRLKQMAKTCYLIYLSTDNSVFENLARQCASCIDHLPWFNRSLHKWELEWQKLSGNNRDGLIHFEIFSDLEISELFGSLVMLSGAKRQMPGYQDNRDRATQPT